MLDIGFQELIILLIIALLVFGPDQLPELGRRLGRAMREFRRASDEFRSTIETNLNLSGETPLPPSALETYTPATIAPVTAAGAPGEPGAEDSAGSLTGGAAPDGALAAPVPDLPAEPFCAQRAGRLLHRSTCAWVERMPEPDRLFFKTAAEGWELRLGPCPVCDPKDAEGVS